MPAVEDRGNSHHHHHHHHQRRLGRNFCLEETDAGGGKSHDCGKIEGFFKP